MLAALFSETIIYEVATPSMWHSTLYPEERRYISNALSKRKREFSAGRACARKALQRAGINHGPLLMDRDRIPLWPDNIVGSISHTEGFCAAAIAPSNTLLGLGFDVERCDRDMTTIQSHICTQGELSWLKEYGNEFEQQWTAVIFSAKESIYKCLYPLTRVFMDFKDVELTLHAKALAFEVDFLTAVLLSEINHEMLKGKFIITPDFIFTSCEYPRCN